MSGMFFLYEITPMDYWGGFIPFEQYAQSCENECDANWARGFLEAAKTAAKKHGWEGDFIAGPFVFGLPSEINSRIGVAWKQYNNGQTFIASMHKLPWLNDIGTETSHAL